MNIRIDDDVPLPQPDKPNTWVTGPKVNHVDDAKRYLKDAEAMPRIVEQSQRYPAETTYDAKGVPTVDCYLVGGPLNGQRGPVKGTAKVVELELYDEDGSVASVELYALGDNPTPTFRHHVGTKLA